MPPIIITDRLVYGGNVVVDVHFESDKKRGCLRSFGWGNERGAAVDVANVKGVFCVYIEQHEVN